VGIVVFFILYFVLLVVAQRGVFPCFKPIHRPPGENGVGLVPGAVVAVAPGYPAQGYPPVGYPPQGYGQAYPAQAQPGSGEEYKVAVAP
jgi:hypothetical protein